MPIYEVKCEKCGHEDEIYRRLAEFDNLPTHCDAVMSRVICAPFIMGDIDPYISQQTGEVIGSRSKHHKHLREHSLTEVGDQSAWLEKNNAEQKKATEKKESKELRQFVARQMDNVRT